MENRSCKIVVFGCGVWGRTVGSFLGADNVDYYCDNNLNIAGGFLMGRPVISYKELLEIYHSENTLIILGLNSFNAEMVAKQLEADGIYDYVFHEFLSGIGVVGKLNAYDHDRLADKAYRYECSIRYMRKRLNDKE